jgi:hypothetical protein
MTSSRKKTERDSPAMPFNEALKRVWGHAPMPKVKAVPGDKKPKDKKA